MAVIKTLILFASLICITRQSDAVDDKERTQSVSSDSQQHLSKAINNFGYKLTLKMMKQNVNENIILAPTGVAGLLAMSLLGSAGTTYDELVAALGFSQGILANRKNHEQFGQLLQTLNGNGTSKTVYADAIFLEPNTKIREVFRDYLKTVYRADALEANFKDGDKARGLINDWVKIHTAGKIEDFLKEPLSPETKLVLVNALYFSGQWDQPFTPEYTRTMTFHSPLQDVKSDLMLNIGQFKYLFSIDNDIHMLALPYNDSTTTMYILKPRFPKRHTLLEVMERLDISKIEDVINQLVPRKVIVRFPKMELNSNVDLRKSLEALGVKSLFNPLKANFALMVDSNTVANSNESNLLSRFNDQVKEDTLKNTIDNLPNPGISVSSIVHEVKMSINEYGTEAVAATAGLLARTAEQFYADSPFYIFIKNEKTQLITFSAVIFDPTTT